jgi:hypothetical protein
LGERAAKLKAAAAGVKQAKGDIAGRVDGRTAALELAAIRER